MKFCLEEDARPVDRSNSFPGGSFPTRAPILDGYRGESDLGVKEITAVTPEKTLAALREYPDIRLAVVDCRMLRTGSEEQFMLIRAGLARHWEGQGQPGPQGTSPLTTQ